MKQPKVKGKTTQPPKDAICNSQPSNFNGLRDILFEELNLLRAGKVSVGRARVTSQLARRIIEAATLDLYAQHQLGGQQNIKRLMSENVQG